MGNTVDTQLRPGGVRIGDIGPGLGPGDGIPALPAGLRHPHSDGVFRGRLSALPDGRILPGTGRKAGRPGMEMRRIPVTGVAGRAPAAAPVPRPRGRAGRAPPRLPDAAGR